MPVGASLAGRGAPWPEHRDCLGEAGGTWAATYSTGTGQPGLGTRQDQYPAIPFSMVVRGEELAHLPKGSVFGTFECSLGAVRVYISVLAILS